VQLDAERLRDLRIFSRTELGEIGRDAIDVIAAKLEAIERAVGDPDLAAAASAAHRARNETLLIGARELSEALESVETAARAGHASRVREGVAAARALWPATRDAIARATYGATD
jgi:HPt (histidine-containing phosphotransfer) domain-containing protein